MNAHTGWRGLAGATSWKPRRRRARLVVALLLMTATGCIGVLAGPDPATTPGSVFDIVWKDFDQNYSLLDIRHIDWAASYARYKPLADAAPSVDAVAPVIAAMFGDLHDPHVDLTTSPTTVLRSVDFSAIHTYFDPVNVLKVYAPSTQMTPSRNLRYGLVAPGIGWVWMPTLSGDGDWSGEMDAVIQGMPGIHALIIDVRDNSGGNSAIGDAVAGRFVDSSRVFSYVRWRNGPAHSDFTDFIAKTVGPAGVRFTGSVIVLTNRKCVSSTEEFLLAMRSQPGVRFVGDTTLGGMGNPMTRELPNGWTYRLPHWIQYGASKQVYEGIGIAPDVVVRATAADSIAGRDVQLERAIALPGG